MLDRRSATKTVIINAPKVSPNNCRCRHFEHCTTVCLQTAMLRSLIFPVLLTPILSQLLSSTVDIKTLSELPLERLLQLKNNFAPKSEELICEDVSQRPQALPLQSKESYGVHEDSKGDKKGIQSIFQISVTTLAFLAFGGYLLCLIVQAIKGKQNYMDSSQVRFPVGQKGYTTVFLE